jgi:hypothetical protein
MENDLQKRLFDFANKIMISLREIRESNFFLRLLDKTSTNK